MRILCCLLVSLWLPICALAQDSTTPQGGTGTPETPQAPAIASIPATGVTDPLASIAPDWEALARRAEQAIDRGQASTDAFMLLRSQLADFRGRFLNADSINAARIETVSNQIRALGPPPTEGETEPAELAQQREELNRQLEELLAPRVAAEAAYSRADGLIREIDTIIRSRQAEALVEAGPSPLVPSHWLVGLRAVSDTILTVKGEVLSNAGNSVRRVEIRNNLPVVLFYLVVGLVLLFRGRAWTEKFALRTEANASERRRRVLSFFLSLGQVLLPVLGIAALTEAVRETDLLGMRGRDIVNALPGMVFIIFGGRWLAGRSFPKSTSTERPLNLPDPLQVRGRLIAASLAVVWALYLLFKTVSDEGNYAPEARAVLYFPFAVIGGFLLWQIGRLLRLHARRDRKENTGQSYRGTILDFAGRGALVLSIMVPLVAAAGYVALSEAILIPSIATLALLSFLSTLQRFFSSVYYMFFGTGGRVVAEGAPGEEAEETEALREPLFPVLMALFLTIASIPALALIWGARVSDLTELWSRFLAGFDLGGARISPSNVLLFAIVFGVGYLLTRALQGALKTAVLPRTALDTGGQNAITSGTGYVGIFISALIAIGAAGIDLSSFAIVAGALSVGIGFGLQAIVSNFVSGIILLIERPISEGDWIEVGDKMGIVQSISVRSTRIQTFDKRDVIVPNSDFISGTVTNWTRGNLIGRVTVSVGVAYGTDTKKVEKILYEICEAHPLVSLDPPPKVFFRNFGADALEFDCFCILKNVNFLLAVHSDINHEIARRFQAEGIEIPFGQRDIWLRNPEALARAAAATAPRAPTIDDTGLDTRDAAYDVDGDGAGDR